MGPENGRCVMSPGLFLRRFLPFVLAALLVGACAPSIEELRDAGDVEGLAEVLQADPDGRVRAAAATALGTLGSVEATPALIAALGDEHARVRATVAHSLGELDAVEATPALIAALGDEHAGVRASVARTLGEVGDVTAVVPLLDASYDEDDAVFERAVAAVAQVLASLPDDEAVEALVSAINDEEANVKEAAEEELSILLADLERVAAAEAVIAADAGDAWLAMALDVAEEDLAAETRVLDLQIEPLAEIQSAAEGVPDETPVAEAHPYEPTDGFHPAIVISPDRREDSSRRWAPTAVRFLELVIIVDEVEWQERAVCDDYVSDERSETAWITRQRAQQTVRVLNASNGELIEEDTFVGSDPRACEDQEAFTDQEVVEGKLLRGDQPDLSDAVTWLESLINPPDNALVDPPSDSGHPWW